MEWYACVWGGEEWQSISALLLSHCSKILPTHLIFDSGIHFHENMRKKRRSSRRRKVGEETKGKREKALVNQAFPFSSYQVVDLVLAHPPGSGSIPTKTH